MTMDRVIEILICVMTVLIMLWLIVSGIWMVTSLAGAEPITEQVWVLCDPDSYVTLREGPGKRKAEFGGVMCGAELWTDNRTKNGFLHVLEIPAEESEGWISSRYVIYDRPAEVNRAMQIRGDGRVALRKWVGGPAKGWILPGETLTVWWMSPSWAVTSRGYIRSEFLEAIP